MTVGSGLSISSSETNITKIVAIIRQLIEGRSNAVGIVTLAHDGLATTTTVSAPACGPNSVPLLLPATAHAATAFSSGSIYVQTADVSARQFIITHAATSQTDQTFWWACFG